MTEQQERRYKEALAHLQALYPGQVVLYTPQMAEFFGRTKRALVQLIQRGRPPVPPRKLGNRWAITIYQAAEWSALDGGLAALRCRASRRHWGRVVDPHPLDPIRALAP